MFKIIDVINQEGQTKELTVNIDQIVFLSKTDIPTNIKGLDGESKIKKGTSIALANGLIINTESTINDIIGDRNGKNKQIQAGKQK